MLTYILYEQKYKQFADVCAYSLKHHSPTTSTEFINQDTLPLAPDKIIFAPLLLASDRDDWFLCCHAKLVFLYNPLILLEYAHPYRTVFKITRFDVFNSPISLWNGENVCLNVETINNTDRQSLIDNLWAMGVGNISNDWAGTIECSNPKAILFDDIIEDCVYTDIWLGYHEAYTECSVN